MDKKLLDYFIDRTDERLDQLDKEIGAKFDKIESKIDTLLKFKWQIISGATVASFLVTLVVQLIFKGNQ